MIPAQAVWSKKLRDLRFTERPVVATGFDTTGIDG
jgi:hypothetical protein